jgi:hypothetical protein
MSAMNRVRFSQNQLTALVAFLVAGALSMAGQAKPTNLFKEVSDRKAKIVWSNAPASMGLRDVCAILGCAAGQDKFIARPKVTEAGKPVARALVLSHDANKGDMVLILRQTPTDAYYFALAPDGSLTKAAYWTIGKPWVAMGTSLSRPVFDKDKQVWLDYVPKLGSAPAATAADSEG